MRPRLIAVDDALGCRGTFAVNAASMRPRLIAVDDMSVRRYKFAPNSSLQ